MGLKCGKCGSKAVMQDVAWDDSQNVRSLKCVCCGNRQEEGFPCRWPFLDYNVHDKAVRYGTPEEEVPIQKQKATKIAMKKGRARLG